MTYDQQQQYPIAPPPELQRLWAQQAQRISPHDPVEWIQYVSEKAAQWGYEQRGEVNEVKLQQARDQELEACCEWLACDWTNVEIADKLRAARRPKPPSLKEQALSELYLAEDSNGAELSKTQFELIRRALEALSDE